MSNWLDDAIPHAIFDLFTRHGFEVFPNYLTNQKSRVTKEQLAESLRQPSVRESAFAWLRHTKERIATLESFMPQEPDLPPSCEHLHRTIDYTDVICQDCGAVVSNEFPKG